MALDFDFSEIQHNLRRLMPVVDAAVSLTYDHYETVAQNQMRNYAPWTDRTGNARNGLRAKHEEEPLKRHELTLFHTMPYGFWLEVRWSGKYAIIGPTIYVIGPRLKRDVIQAIDAAVQRMGR